LDYFKQLCGIEWFVQKINGAFVEGSLSNFIITVVGSYKYDRQRRTHEPDATLQLDTIHSWHANVGYHTSRRS